MKVIIAEKRDQGLTIASPFQIKKHDGFVEILPNELFPKGAYVTWAIGHLFQLLPPEKYRSEWKKWSLDTLPIIPDTFRYEVERGKAKQFQTIKQLLMKKEVTEIIHAGDAGREGELIIRNIIQMCGVKKPMKRLWLSSLTKKAIYEGFQRLLDETETRPLYEEAYARSCADWLVGMNASRAYSLLMQQKGIKDVFSVGRVQTPTLALIVKREKEIAEFRSEPFWEVVATFNIEGKRYVGKWHQDGETRVKEKMMAEKIAAFCREKTATVKDVLTERKTFLPPLLFNLSSLQATANQRYKFSPQKTLDVLQQLYQKGFVSYPRSDSQYVTQGEAETFPDVLHKLSQISEYRELIPKTIPSILHNKRYVNEKKVTDHYAIIPTEQVPNVSKLSPDEQKIYDLVARRLIAAHYPPAVFDYTTIFTLVDGRAEFVTKGKQQIEEGWRKVIHAQQEEEEVPHVRKGETGVVQSVNVKEGKTEPPKRYTEGQLITLMKTAGKYVENEELEKILKKTEGLGTEATRASIITLLKERKYIVVKNNQVYATDKGKVLIEAIGEQILASPEMTAKWEQRLSEIGEGKASAATFIEQAKKLATKVVQDAIMRANEWDFSKFDTQSIRRKKKATGTRVGSCPLCDGTIVDKGDFYGCSHYAKNGCRFTISKTILGKTISQANMKKLLKEGETNVIKGFKKGDKTFDAKLQWRDNQLRFVIETDQ
ncbi:DNA topoisomerase-3 [Thermolongibacillus altinsuensis]|uniref:DNA topoisomerase n=1 Tax=Thermolongibacillus altinsuensis TaxID=575256 RepID=A0A4R1QDN6_9BACL|nr:DNA topoisomerase III [Thermolongibacillus altinsuensis]TCL48053.1 DNA topoisomerase-3 [Thermolongibacillus altinsuensis]